MNDTRVVNLHAEKYDTYIGRGRGSIWGNPFSHKKGTLAEFRVASREEAIAKFRAWIVTQPWLMAQLETLRGKRLGCFCKPAACHGDVLVELLERAK